MVMLNTIIWMINTLLFNIHTIKKNAEKFKHPLYLFGQSFTEVTMDNLPLVSQEPQFENLPIKTRDKDLNELNVSAERLTYSKRDV